MKLGDGGKATSFFASDLTRQHLREVVSLFIATQSDAHLLPFQRLGTGSLNLPVFALLTFIADLKDKQSAILAREEPEIYEGVSTLVRWQSWRVEVLAVRVAFNDPSTEEIAP